MYFVAVYLEDRDYGGPEEGGWYYHCGELVTDVEVYHEAGIGLPRAYSFEFLAVEACQQMNEALDATVNVGRRPISSYLSDGRYAAHVFEDELLSYFPKVKPRYE